MLRWHSSSFMKRGGRRPKVWRQPPISTVPNVGCANGVQSTNSLPSSSLSSKNRPDARGVIGLSGRR